MKARSKNFMSLPKKECLTVSVLTLENAVSKYNEAQILARNNSFGTASSLLVTAMEESIKSTILLLDANGFELRKRLSKIESVFKHHSLRYQLGFLITIFGMLFRDFLKLTRTIMRSPTNRTFEINPVKVHHWFKVKISQVKRELSWFEQLGLFRENGLYVDVDHQINQPNTVSEVDFLNADQRVSRVLDMVKGLSVICEDESNLIALNILRKQFVLNKLFEHFSRWTGNSHRDPFIFDRCRDFILEIEELLSDNELLIEMTESYENFKKNWNSRLENK